MTDWLLDIWIPGTPVTQGSMKHVGGGRMVHPEKLLPWRRTITQAVEQYTGTYFGGWEPLDEPVEVQATFYLERPPSVQKRPLPHRGGGDLDKYARALGDALAPKLNKRPTPGAFLMDDSRITDLRVRKRYVHGMPGEDGEIPGVRVKVRRV